jgi:hypothetical protein
MGEPGSSVSMVSGHGLDDRMIEVRSPAEAKGFFVCVQTSSGVHPASCTMGTGVPFPGAKRGRGVTLTTHPHLVPRSWMSRSYTSSVPSPFAACSGTALAFNYIGTDSSSIYRLCLYVCSVLKSEWLTYLSSHTHVCLYSEFWLRYLSSCERKKSEVFLHFTDRICELRLAITPWNAGVCVCVCIYIYIHTHSIFCDTDHGRPGVAYQWYASMSIFFVSCHVELMYYDL